MGKKSFCNEGPSNKKRSEAIRLADERMQLLETIRFIVKEEIQKAMSTTDPKEKHKL